MSDDNVMDLGLMRLRPRAEEINGLEFGAFMQSCDRILKKQLEVDEIRSHLMAAMARLGDCHHMIVQSMAVMQRQGPAIEDQN